MSNDQVMTEIVQRCLRIDTAANTAYTKLAGADWEPRLRDFWQEMAGEELEHCHFWQQLLTDAQKEPLPRVFLEAEKILAELDQNAVDAEVIAREPLTDLTVHQAFLRAFKMEFYLLHPALEVMFHLLGREDSREIENEYEEHIAGFLDELKRHGASEEMELIATLLSRMWVDNRQLADEYKRVKELNGLLPICSACKSIRDDKGYWSRIEQYISDHSDARFTHGICPECAEKLYGEVLSGSTE